VASASESIPAEAGEDQSQLAPGIAPQIDRHPNRPFPSSSGYLLGAVIALILPSNESLHQTRRGTSVALPLGFSKLTDYIGKSLLGTGGLQAPATPSIVKSRIIEGGCRHSR